MTPDTLISDTIETGTVTVACSWYPEHTLLAKCLAKSEEDHVRGPATLSAGILYCAAWLIEHGIQETAMQHLGAAILSRIEWAVSLSLEGLMRPACRKTWQVLPFLVEFTHQMGLAAVEADRPDVYEACHGFLHALADCRGVTLDMLAMLERQHRLFAELDELGMAADRQEDFIDAFSNACNPFFAAYGDLPQALAPTPVDGKEASPKAPHPLPDPDATGFRIPETVTHVDGSIGVDAHDDLVAILSPKVRLLKDAAAQWADTLDQFAGPTRECLALWQHIHPASRSSEAQSQHEAKLMLHAGKLLEYLFTRQQIAILNHRIPMDRVLDGFLTTVQDLGDERSFLADLHVSAQQLRISYIAACIIGLSTQENLHPLATALYKELGLDAETPLLLATIDLHGEEIRSRMIPIIPPKHALTLQ